MDNNEWMQRATRALMGFTGQPEEEAREDMETLALRAPADDTDPERWVEERVYEAVCGRA